MGTKFSSTKYQPNRHELIVFGYIRTNILNCIIPSEIQRLCCDFYYQADLCMFLTIGSLGCTRMDFNSIQCINIKSGDTYNVMLTDVENEEHPSILQTNEQWDKMFYGECMQHNVPLPQWIVNKNLKQVNKNEINPNIRYNILYRIAGAYGKNLKLSETTNCFLYNSNDTDPHQRKNKNNIINAYYFNMPSLGQGLTSVTSVIHKNSNSIYTIGRSEYGKNYIYELNLNNKELKWNRYEGILKSKIFGIGLCILNKTNYNENNKDVVMLMCGGRNINRNMINSVNIINLTKGNVINMSDMNHKRSYFNCVSKTYNNIEYIVGGGYDKCKTLEIFDIVKDKWTIVKQETNYFHEWKSVVYMDNCNDNIVYIAGGKLGYDQLRNLGYIEWCDLRENTNKFQVFKNKSISNLFNIKGSNINDKWESRSLLV